MEYHTQYRLAPKKIANPARDYSSAIKVLLGACAITSVCVMMVLALFDVI